MNMKRVFCLMLAVVMCALCACAPTAGTTGLNGTTVPSGSAQYKVNVIDPEGNPCANDVVVKFMKDGKQAGMQSVDAAGVAAKELQRGNYTVELMFTDPDASYSYAGADLQMTATKTELTIQLYNSVGAVQSLYVKLNADESADRPAYDVKIGQTKVELEAGTRNFFIFTPRKGGVYKFSISGGAEAIGYFGAAHFVAHINSGKPVEGETAVTLEVKQSSVSTSETGSANLVLGVDAGSATSGILNIERIGDDTPPIPYDTYPTTTVLKPYTHPAGAALAEFDMDASYEIVYNEEDGYYHVGSENGPLVLMRLGKNSDDYCKYLIKSVETVNEMEAYVRHYYDEAGNETSRVTFTPSLLEHMKYMDVASGLYPVTKELRYIIQERGETKGWWDISVTVGEGKANNYLFWDQFGNPDPVNVETAWLFNCCYIPE